MEKLNLKIYKGQTYQRNFIISDFDYDINQIYFTVKEQPDNKYVALQKKLNDGIQLMDIDEKTGAKIYLLSIEPDDTENLKTTYNYGYDITIRAGNNNFIKEPIIMGSFCIEPVYTTKKEENNE